MKLSELYIGSPSFEDEEFEALDGLPINEDGLEELLDYLMGCDSPEGWKRLFTDFSELIPERKREELLRRARRIFSRLPWE